MKTGRSALTVISAVELAGDFTSTHKYICMYEPECLNKFSMQRCHAKVGWQRD